MPESSMRLLALTTFFVAWGASAQAQPAVNYRLDIEASGRVKVEIRLAEPVAAPRAFVMPRAIPMGYQQHPYDRFVENVRAFAADATAVAVARDLGPRWRLGAAGERVARVSYEIDIARMEREILSGGDASRVRPDYVYLLGYATFGYVDGFETGVPAQLEAAGPDGWPVFSTLSPTASPGPRVAARAADFYGLADSQVIAGRGVTLRAIETAVRAPLFLAVRAEFEVDEARIAALAREAYERMAEYFGGAPFPHYTAIFEFLDPVSDRHTYGFSMEHLDSATFCLGRDRGLTAASPERDVNGFRVNVAHHMAHAWIPKRAAGPGYFPFSWEVAPALDTIWFAEGFGQYAAVDALADGLPADRRAAYVEGVLDLRFRATLREMPRFLLEMPLDQLSHRGSFVYSEDFRVGRTLFSRGGLMAAAMDARIRERTGGAKRLRDALRHLIAWSATNKRPFTTRELPAIFREGTGVDTADILEQWLGPVRPDMIGASPGRQAGASAAARPAQRRPMSRKEKIVAGALIGAGAGALVGLLPTGREACLDQSTATCVLKGATLGTSIGIVVGISLRR